GDDEPFGGRGPAGAGRLRRPGQPGGPLVRAAPPGPGPLPGLPPGAADGNRLRAHTLGRGVAAGRGGRPGAGGRRLPHGRGGSGPHPRPPAPPGLVPSLAPGGAGTGPVGRRPGNFAGLRTQPGGFRPAPPAAAHPAVQPAAGRGGNRRPGRRPALPAPVPVPGGHRRWAAGGAAGLGTGRQRWHEHQPHLSNRRHRPAGGHPPHRLEAGGQAGAGGTGHPGRGSGGAVDGDPGHQPAVPTGAGHLSTLLRRGTGPVTILQIFAVALLGLLLSVLLRRERPEMAVLLSIGLGVVVLAALLRQIGSLLDLITGLVARAQLDLRYAGSLTRIIGIAYLTEFGAQVCRDAGEGNLAGKVELAGKISILVLAVPIVLAVLETLLRLLPA